MGPIRWIVFAVLLSTLCVAARPARAASPPPGATALCRDGTYSYSRHHSGSCSHHGGVAKWLDSTTQTTSSPSPTSTPTSTPALGRTVLLARRTRTSGCSRGPNPDPHCSPGATYSGLTRAVLCSSTFRTSTIRNVPDSVKHAVEVEYGMVAKPYGRTIEIDHIVSLELGGSNDIANLFPEPGSGPASYHVKDRLENKLHSLVCSGGITLRAAQVGIASHWQALYLRVFGVASGG